MRPWLKIAVVVVIVLTMLPSEVTPRGIHLGDNRDRVDEIAELDPRFIFGLPNPFEIFNNLIQLPGKIAQAIGGTIEQATRELADNLQKLNDELSGRGSNCQQLFGTVNTTNTTDVIVKTWIPVVSWFLGISNSQTSGDLNQVISFPRVQADGTISGSTSITLRDVLANSAFSNSVGRQSLRLNAKGNVEIKFDSCNNDCSPKAVVVSILAKLNSTISFSLPSITLNSNNTFIIQSLVNVLSAGDIRLTNVIIKSLRNGDKLGKALSAVLNYLDDFQRGDRGGSDGLFGAFQDVLQGIFGVGGNIFGNIQKQLEASFGKFNSFNILGQFLNGQNSLNDFFTKNLDLKNILNTQSGGKTLANILGLNNNRLDGLNLIDLAGLLSGQGGLFAGVNITALLTAGNSGQPNIPNLVVDFQALSAGNKDIYLSALLKDFGLGYVVNQLPLPPINLRGVNFTSIISILIPGFNLDVITSFSKVSGGGLDLPQFGKILEGFLTGNSEGFKAINITAFPQLGIFLQAVAQSGSVFNVSTFWNTILTGNFPSLPEILNRLTSNQASQQTQQLIRDLEGLWTGATTLQKIISDSGYPNIDNILHLPQGSISQFNITKLLRTVSGGTGGFDIPSIISQFISNIPQTITKSFTVISGYLTGKNDLQTIIDESANSALNSTPIIPGCSLTWPMVLSAIKSFTNGDVNFPLILSNLTSPNREIQKIIDDLNGIFTGGIDSQQLLKDIGVPDSGSIPGLPPSNLKAFNITELLKLLPPSKIPDFLRFDNILKYFQTVISNVTGISGQVLLDSFLKIEKPNLDAIFTFLKVFGSGNIQTLLEKQFNFSQIFNLKSGDKTLGDIFNLGNVNVDAFNLTGILQLFYKAGGFLNGFNPSTLLQLGNSGQPNYGKLIAAFSALIQGNVSVYFNDILGAFGLDSIGPVFKLPNSNLKGFDISQLIKIFYPNVDVNAIQSFIKQLQSNNNEIDIFGKFYESLFTGKFDSAQNLLNISKIAPVSGAIAGIWKTIIDGGFPTLPNILKQLDSPDNAASQQLLQQLEQLWTGQTSLTALLDNSGNSNIDNILHLPEGSSLKNLNLTRFLQPVSGGGGFNPFSGILNQISNNAQLASNIGIIVQKIVSAITKLLQGQGDFTTLIDVSSDPVFKNIALFPESQLVWPQVVASIESFLKGSINFPSVVTSLNSTNQRLQEILNLVTGLWLGKTDLPQILDASGAKDLGKLLNIPFFNLTEFIDFAKILRSFPGSNAIFPSGGTIWGFFTSIFGNITGQAITSFEGLLQVFKIIDGGQSGNVVNLATSFLKNIGSENVQNNIIKLLTAQNSEATFGAFFDDITKFRAAVAKLLNLPNVNTTALSLKGFLDLLSRNGGPISNLNPLDFLSALKSGAGFNITKFGQIVLRLTNGNGDVSLNDILDASGLCDLETLLQLPNSNLNGLNITKVWQYFNPGSSINLSSYINLFSGGASASSTLLVIVQSFLTGNFSSSHQLNLTIPVFKEFINLFHESESQVDVSSLWKIISGGNLPSIPKIINQIDSINNNNNSNFQQISRVLQQLWNGTITLGNLLDGSGNQNIDQIINLPKDSSLRNLNVTAIFRSLSGGGGFDIPSILLRSATAAPNAIQQIVVLLPQVLTGSKNASAIFDISANAALANLSILPKESEFTLRQTVSVVKFILDGNLNFQASLNQLNSTNPELNNILEGFKQIAAGTSNIGKIFDNSGIKDFSKLLGLPASDFKEIASRFLEFVESCRE